MDKTIDRWTDPDGNGYAFKDTVARAQNRALINKISTETADRKAEVNTERKRIDNLIASGTAQTQEIGKKIIQDSSISSSGIVLKGLTNNNYYYKLFEESGSIDSEFCTITNQQGKYTAKLLKPGLYYMNFKVHVEMSGGFSEEVIAPLKLFKSNTLDWSTFDVLDAETVEISKTENTSINKKIHFLFKITEPSYIRIYIDVDTSHTKAITFRIDGCDITALDWKGKQSADLSELHDLRIGADSTVYGTAGEAVRKQIGNLTEEFVDKLSELTSTTNCKFSQFAKIVDAKEAMIVEYKKYNDNEIYDVSVATGKNLLPVSIEYPSVINVPNGAVIKFTNSGIINYNGEKAIGESIEQNVLDTDRFLFKVPFEAELSNKFNVTKGGFTSHVWIDDGQGNLSIEEFTHGAITLKKGTIIKRIWFKANGSNSIFDVAFSLVEKGEEADYTAPTLKIYTNDDLQKIKFAYGTNYVIPNFINDAKENTIVYMDDNCISKQQKFALVKVTTDESVINIPQTISTQKFLNRDKKWNIYGKDKNLSVLKCDDVNYSCSILELCAGIVKNVMLYNATMGESNKGYCVHLDSNNLENEYVLFENCIFKSTEGISIGIGTRAGSTIVFKNCEFITEDDSYTFYIHNTESEGKNKCSIVIENCLFRTNGEICMLIQDWQGCCKNDFLFVNNTFMNDDKYNLNNAVKINYHHGVEENSTDWKNLLSLNKSSHGNNITFLNAVN